MKLGYCFAAALGSLALALFAMPTIAVGAEAAAAACSDGSCGSDCCSGSCKKEKEDAQPVTIDLQRRCYASKCETIKFPCSPICSNLFHGWKKTPQCSDCSCACPDEVPCAKCGCEYLHKTQIVKIRHINQPINICPTCGQSGAGFTVNYGAQPRPPQPAPAPEMVPAPRPAAPMPKPAAE
jgi:hypothetical protein